MKLNTTNGTVTLVSENKKEAMQLFAYALDRQNTENVIVEEVKTKQAHKPYKKYTLTKRCKYCNKPCRGGTGLSAHERRCAHRRDPQVISLIPS